MVTVGRAAQLLQQIGPLAYLGRYDTFSTSLKCVTATTLGGSGACDSWCSAAASNPMPSTVRVPLPNSSMMHSDLQADTGLSNLKIAEWMQ